MDTLAAKQKEQSNNGCKKNLCFSLVFNIVFFLSQIVINPNYEVAESDYTNNVMKCRSRYDGQRMWTYNCHIGETPFPDKDSALHLGKQ